MKGDNMEDLNNISNPDEQDGFNFSDENIQKIENAKADREAHDAYMKIQQQEFEAAKDDYLLSSAYNTLPAFVDGIEDSVNTPVISTGFNNLDVILDGGLYEGLYTIGAISSLGKTTLALQIIDQIAQQGQDCIIFSLEMARYELIAKSISRNTFLSAEQKSLAKTTRGITSGTRWKNYSDEEKNLINTALRNYQQYADHIFIHEGVGDIGIEQIKEVVNNHIFLLHRKPVILIDYLQILDPVDRRATDKWNTDKAVLELKRLSRDCKIPILAISSFNRQSYIEPVNMGAFKESGAIEYSADVLIGLQYEGMDYKDDERDGDRQKRIRKLIKDMEQAARSGEAQQIQVKVLKSRNGSKGQTSFNFYAMFNCFLEEGFESDKSGEGDKVFQGVTVK